MEEERSKVPGIEDVKWLLEQAEEACSRLDTQAQLRRLAEARFAIDLMYGAAVVERLNRR